MVVLVDVVFLQRYEVRFGGTGSGNSSTSCMSCARVLTFLIDWCTRVQATSKTCVKHCIMQSNYDPHSNRCSVQLVHASVDCGVSDEQVRTNEKTWRTWQIRWTL